MVQTAGKANALLPEDRVAHGWYRFVLSFPPQLVRKYLEQFALTPAQTVLDPFCGTGTTLVECKKRGIPSIGIEANSIAYFATRTKVNWNVAGDELLSHARQIAEAAQAELNAQGIFDELLLGSFNNQNNFELRTLPEEAHKLLLTHSISPLPLHKALVLLDHIRQQTDPRYTDWELLAFAKALVESASNLYFGPEVGLGAIKTDTAVVAHWLAKVKIMASDLEELHELQDISAHVYQADARLISEVLEPGSINAVITSPPYPNEKDYTRTTRLEAVLLGFIRDKQELQTLKRRLLRSNTRNVYKGDDDDKWISHHLWVQQIAKTIEARRIELGKTSGFERLYARTTRLYFGGISQHLANLRPALSKGANLAYVVGDQASYLRVPIETGPLLADIAYELGYEVVDIDPFRTRLATISKEQLREEVVVLRWPGKQSKTFEFNLKDIAMSEKAPDNETPGKPNRYSQIIERIFAGLYQEGAREVLFERADLVRVAQELKIDLPKNLGDVIYSFRYRSALPASLQAKAAAGETWIIRPMGRSRYGFALVSNTPFTPRLELVETKLPDSTPGIVAKYMLEDEQALLTRLRYNRLIDIFTGITCYSLQNHLRTALPGIGQVETDEIYVGVNKQGVHYIFPIQAKGGKDKLNIVQIEQDFALCAKLFPGLVCRPLGVQFMEDSLIALFEFEMGNTGVALKTERHYRLVPPDEVTTTDLQLYKERLDNE